MSKKIVVDLDGTLCEQGDINTYADVFPISENIERVNDLWWRGWDVTIFTARGMDTFKGNVDVIEQKLGWITKKWLEDHGVWYTRLKFGKPPGDHYVDDKAISAQAFSKMSVNSLDGTLIRRKVFTNGCFDIIHRGHLSLLKFCRELAGPEGRVIVGLNSDQSVTKLKGPGRPLVSVADRTAVLSELRDVDEVAIFHELTPIELIDRVNPDIIVKGSEYNEKDVVGYGKYPVILAPRIEGISTTELVRRARGNYCE